MLKVLFLLVGMAQILYGHPENQIILVENIVPPHVANALIQYYDSERQNLAVSRGRNCVRRWTLQQAVLKGHPDPSKDDGFNAERFEFFS
jgi:hypothetical protein